MTETKEISADVEQTTELTTGQKACQWLEIARVALHARILFFENYKVNNAASKRYTSLTITAIEKARMYMGKLIGVYSNSLCLNPYPDGYNAENSNVAKMADTYSGALPTVHTGQEIIHIKQQRADISKMITGLESFRNHFALNSNGNLFLNQSVLSLYDSTNWLGMELYSLGTLANHEKDTGDKDLPNEETVISKIGDLLK